MEEFKIGVLYKHKKNRDTAIVIRKVISEEKVLVDFYNITLAKDENQSPFEYCCGYSEIRLDKRENYEELLVGEQDGA